MIPAVPENSERAPTTMRGTSLDLPISPPPGRPKEGSLPLGGKARSAKGAPMSPPPGRPKEGSLPLGGKARSAKGAP